MNTPPTLTTDRLILRLPEARDFAPYTEFMASQRALDADAPALRFEAWISLAAELGHWQLRGYGMFAVQEKSNDETAGMVGIFNPAGWPEPELGWTMFAGFEGRGYASEAAQRARDWAYGSLGWTSLISIIPVGNAASVKLAERLGATLERNWTYPSGDAAQIFRHPGLKARP